MNQQALSPCIVSLKYNDRDEAAIRLLMEQWFMLYKQGNISKHGQKIVMMLSSFILCPMPASTYDSLCGGMMMVMRLCDACSVGEL